jgi:DNA-binding CsgD family transcriptional regulator
MYVSFNALQQALRLIDDLAELDDPACFPKVALSGLSQLIGCDYLSYNELDPGPVLIHAVVHPLDELPVSLELFDAHIHEHPLINHYRNTCDRRPRKISDFLSDQDFHRLSLYGEFFRVMTVEHQMAVNLTDPGPQIIGIAFNRSRTDFTEAHRDLLDVVRRRQSAGQALRGADPERLAGLTDREVQVLDLVARGRTNAAIARTLDVSPRTIAKHLEHIYRKLEVTSRAAAVYQVTP